MDGPEYREKLLSHAVKRGFGKPRLRENKWTFKASSNARAIVEYEPTLTEKSGYLIWAKGQLTSAMNTVSAVKVGVRKPQQIPTKVYDQPWLHAFAPEQPEYIVDSEAGKWMMFVGHEYADDTWKNVSRAIKEGRLSYYGKMSTIAMNLGTFPYVLCVYISDYRDRESAIVLREKLRDMGFKRKIYFKRDSMTQAGISGSEFGA